MQTSSRPLRTAVLASAWLVAAACGESTAPVAPTLDDALAQVNTADQLSLGVAASLGVVSGPSVSAPSVCPFNASNQRFVCPTVTASGMTMDRYYQLLDASGAPLSAWSTSVAKIRNVNDMTGTLTVGTAPNTITISLTGHDDATLSGLRDERQTLNGTGTSSWTQTGGGVTGTFNSTRTVTNLVLPKRGSSEQYPKSGSIAMSMTGTGSSAATTVTMTFNGTSTVTMTTQTGTGPVVTCTINLANAQSAPVCS